MTIEEITPELIESFTRLNKWYTDRATGLQAADWRNILAALPEAVTNPKPELPSEPGWYLDKDNFVWTLDEAGWSLNAHEYAPYTRLVPEKPPVTAEEVWEILDGQNVDSSVLSELANYINNR